MEDMHERTKYLTLVGMTGSGKSTLANISSHSQSWVEPISYTCELSHYAIPGRDWTLVDAPGLDTLSLLANKIFQTITSHLHEHGGIVVLVLNYSELTQSLVGRFEALSRTINAPFATYCILVTTIPRRNRYFTTNENAGDLDNYQQELERGVNECIHRGAFARKYVVSTNDKESCYALQRSLKRDVASIPGLSRGVVQPWENMLALIAEKKSSRMKEQFSYPSERFDRRCSARVLASETKACFAVAVAANLVQFASVAVGIEALPIAIGVGALMMWSANKTVHLQAKLDSEHGILKQMESDVTPEDRPSTSDVDTWRIRLLLG